MNAKPRTAYLLSLAAAAALGGCSTEVTYDDPRLEQIDAELVRAESCEDLQTKVRADAMARIDRQLDAYLLMADQFDNQGGSRAPFDRGDYAGYDGGGEEDSFAGDDGSESVAASGTGSGGGGSGAPTSGGGGGQPAPDHSGTNNQVDGIDEADIVKTDGLNLYVLHGAELSIIKAWPATELAVTQSLALEGSPIEMFVEGGKAVIFARAEGSAIYDAAGVSPKHPFTEGWYYGGGYADGPDYRGDGCYDACGPSNSLTQVVVVDLSSGSPTVEREFFFEGDYLSSRREDNQVRVVLSGGAHLPNVDVYPSCEDGCNDADDWRDAVESARVRAYGTLALAKLEDFVPYRFSRSGGVVTQLETGCDGYWVPTPGSSEYGLTQIETFDLGDIASGPKETAIVGAVQTVYANGSTMVLAGQSFDTSRFAAGLADTDEFIVNRTHLHRFDLDVDPQRATYTGSASIPGTLIDQFAIDEKDGVLRLATHVQLSNGNEWRENNALYTVSGPSGALSIAGRVEGVAPNEQMYSARFVGNRGYFVTFEQVDPLFVFDLSNPAAPTLQGELTIPGFSEYMHPIDEGHLLTIGVDDGGWGLALQIFDVTDALHPLLAHKLSLGDATSEALYEHKAFTFWRDMLAIPVQGWNGDTYEAGLSLFSVDVATGFGEKGTIDHSEFFDLDQSYNYCSPGGVRRGVFIENFIYSVSDGGVLVHDVADLSVPVAGAEFTSFNASSACDQYYY